VQRQGRSRRATAERGGGGENHAQGQQTWPIEKTTSRSNESRKWSQKNTAKLTDMAEIIEGRDKKPAEEENHTYSELGSWDFFNSHQHK